MADRVQSTADPRMQLTVDAPSPFPHNDANQVTGLNRFSQQVANPNDPTTVFSDSLAYSVYSYDIAGRMTGLVNTAAQTGSSTQH